MDAHLKTNSAVTSSTMGLLILMSFKTALMYRVVTIFLAKFATVYAMVRANSGCLMEEYSLEYSNSIRCSKEICMKSTKIKIISDSKSSMIIKMLFRTRLLRTNKSQ